MSKRMHLSIAGLLLGLPLVAAGEPQQSEQLSDYTVTARPLNARGVSIAQPVEILSGDELDRQRQSNIGETLAQMPGISSSDFGQAVSRPVIRGLGGLRLRVLSSGIGAMDLSATSADHAVNASTYSASQVEILKGPATLLYGSGAIAGVVNLVDTRIPVMVPESTSFDIKAGYGDPARQRQYQAALETGHGDFAVHLDGSRHIANDYESGSGRVENSDSELTDRAIGFSWLPGDHIVGFSINEQDHEYGIPGEDARIDMNQTRYDLKTELQTNLGWLEQINMRIGASNYEHSELEDGAVGSLFENDAYEARLELMLPESANWSAMLGLQASGRDLSVVGDEAYLPPVESDSLAIFTLHSFNVAGQTLNLGLRLEAEDHNPGAGQVGVNQDLYSLSAEWISQLPQGLELSFTAGRAQRGPAAEELYANGPHLATSTFETGSVALSEETANHLDLGLHYRAAEFGWRFNLFVNLIEDFIFQQSQDVNLDGIADRRTEEGDFSIDSDDLLDVIYTQSDALFYGFEFEADYRLFNNEYGELKLLGMADAVRGRLTDGDDLPRITPPRLGLGLDYQRGRWSGQMDVMHNFRQDEVAALETETAAYTMVGADLAYHGKAKQLDYTLRAYADNLLDETARRHTSFIKDLAPLPGRTYGLSAELSF